MLCLVSHTLQPTGYDRPVPSHCAAVTQRERMGIYPFSVSVQEGQARFQVNKALGISSFAGRAVTLHEAWELGVIALSLASPGRRGYDHLPQWH